MIGAITALALIAAGVTALVLHREPKAGAPVSLANADTKAVLDALEKEPCDAAKSLDLATLLLNSGDNRGAVNSSGRFLAQCGELTKLRWIRYEAYQRLFEWKAAAGEATHLIQEDRYDPDYWWWRGLMLVKANDFAAAESDFRMANALCVGCKSHLSLADVLERQKRPCEAVVQLEQFRQTVPNVDHDYINRRVRILNAEGQCRPYFGRGRLRVPLSRDRHAWLAVNINGRAAGTFLVDTGASMVALPRKLAHELGVEETSTMLVAQTANGLVPARLGRARSVSVGPLAADHVEVAIMEGDSEVLLLGMSFLSRFDVQIKQSVLTLASPSNR